MTQPITPADLAAMEARCAAATAGPWEHEWTGYRYAIESRDGVIAKLSEYVTMEKERMDAEFIAASRTDIPRLLAEVRRLREQLGEHHGCD